jgi:hypothetical protein
VRDCLPDYWYLTARALIPAQEAVSYPLFRTGAFLGTYVLYLHE